MWNVEPKLMCRKHLLGEHFEMHCFVGHIKQGKKYNGFLKNGMLEIHNIKNRHDQIVNEMEKRGYKHNTPLNFFTNLIEGKIDEENNINILYSKCSECRRIMEEVNERPNVRKY